ncbi:MAG: DNA-directed RNA polymerase subunit omega [Deferribacteres bacterium]|nr:DNA-directed RNA polymerase subunit omega [candidate division KSB1 bacterium]MCB9509271.1 DNA-directed RNA polymerase subunit omega [Deferribacteres bacterium]
MVETIDLKKINEKADNIYEAIISIARRARQINDDQRVYYERETELEETTDFDDDELEKINLDDIGVNLPKPSKIALDEFMAEELNIEYVEDNVN